MSDVFLSNLSSPPLLFFFLGAAAVIARSDLDIPNQIAKFLSLYLLFAIGFKGGVALSESSISSEVVATLLAAMVLSAVIPLIAWIMLRHRFSPADCAAIAATYGSVSAVTFVTTAGYLDMQGIEWSGHLVAAMALMESPAIIAGILIYRRFSGEHQDTQFSWGALLREACFNGSVFLIMGSMLIGWFTGSAGMDQVDVLVKDMFLGLLCLFLLDMGIVAARRLRDLKTLKGSNQAPFTLTVWAALLLPVMNGCLALAVAVLLELDEGNALLFVLLGASASYIAVPAAMRLALPAANPGIYLPMSLAVTFPVNILIGIPAWHAMVRWLL